MSDLGDEQAVTKAEFLRALRKQRSDGLRPQPLFLGTFGDGTRYMIQLQGGVRYFYRVTDIGRIQILGTGNALPIAADGAYDSSIIASGKTWLIGGISAQIYGNLSADGAVTAVYAYDSINNQRTNLASSPGVDEEGCAGFFGKEGPVFKFAANPIGFLVRGRGAPVNPTFVDVTVLGWDLT